MTERKVSSERLSEERLLAMLAGLDGVTPGPRHVYRDTLSKAIYVTDDAGNTMALFSPMEDDHRADAANADQFASCDDEAIRAIISELLALRSSVKTVAPSEYRQTFTIPDGHEAVLDADGRATGETRPMAPSKVTEEMVERLFVEMDRRMGLQKHIHQEPNPDWLPVDDTQIGVEFAVEFITAALKGDRP